MPKIKDLATEVLGEDLAIQINWLDCRSVDDFLKSFEELKSANRQFINDQVIELLRCAAIAKNRPIVKSGSYLCQRSLKNVQVLSCGNAQVDELLGGGLFTWEVVEIFGLSGKGKTQFALHCSVLACIKHHDNVVFMDASGSFSAQRTRDIINKFSTSSEVADRVLKKIMVFNCFDVFSLQEILYDIIKKKKKKAEDIYSRVKLVVIDSILNILSPVIGYKFREGYAAASELGLTLRRLARECYVAVLIINGTVTSETQNGQPKAALGGQWHQISDRRLLITGFDDTAPPSYNIHLLSN